jgi:gluconolactonase
MLFCSGVYQPEGPVYLPDGSWAITEMEPGCITHISANGRQRHVIASTGRPNGLALDGDGNLWVAESRYPALMRVTPEGEIMTVARGAPELPFLWPNDLCFGPDGALFMTDSGVSLDDFEGITPPLAAYDVPLDGRVWRIEPATGDCALLDRGLRFANGIAFGPGGEDLFVSETLTGLIYHYRIKDGRVDGDRQAFADVMRQPPQSYGLVAGPDGMAFDSAGNLYVAVLRQGDITVLDPSGLVIRRLDIPGDFPTNVAFGSPRSRNLLVTEGSGSQLLVLEDLAEGLALYYPVIQK